MSKLLTIILVLGLMVSAVSATNNINIVTNNMSVADNANPHSDNSGSNINQNNAIDNPNSDNDGSNPNLNVAGNVNRDRDDNLDANDRDLSNGLNNDPVNTYNSNG